LYKRREVGYEKNIIFIIFIICINCIVFNKISFGNNFDEKYKLIINSEEIGEIVRINDEFYLNGFDTQNIFENIEGVKTCIIAGCYHYLISDLAIKNNYDIFYNKYTGSCELYNKLTKNEKGLVAHAGGFLDGYLVNMKESLDLSKINKMKLVEIDFIWTEDGIPVLSHDWDTVSKYSKVKFTGKLSLQDFLNNEFKFEWTPLSLDGLCEWLKENKDVFIVTDVKEKNIEMLKIITVKYPELLNRFIPQVYSIKEYIEVSKLNYERIIFTLYKLEIDSNTIFNDIMKIQDNKLFAITMPKDRADDGLAQNLKDNNIYVYVHTINDYLIRKNLSGKGVDGFYTDVFNIDLP